MDNQIEGITPVAGEQAVTMDNLENKLADLVNSQKASVSEQNKLSQQWSDLLDSSRQAEKQQKEIDLKRLRLNLAQKDEIENIREAIKTADLPHEVRIAAYRGVNSEVANSSSSVILENIEKATLARKRIETHAGEPLLKIGLSELAWGKLSDHPYIEDDSYYIHTIGLDERMVLDLPFGWLNTTEVHRSPKFTNEGAGLRNIEAENFGSILSEDNMPKDIYAHLKILKSLFVVGSEAVAKTVEDVLTSTHWDERVVISVMLLSKRIGLDNIEASRKNQITFRVWRNKLMDAIAQDALEAAESAGDIEYRNRYELVFDNQNFLKMLFNDDEAYKNTTEAAVKRAIESRLQTYRVQQRQLGETTLQLLEQTYSSQVGANES